MTQGFVAVLRKHLRAEIANTPGAAEALRNVRIFWSTFPAQRFLRPVSSAVLSLSLNTGRAVLGAASIAEAEIKRQKQNLLSCTARALFLPFSGAGIVLHAAALGVGRVFTPGKQYSSPIRAHPWSRAAEPQTTTGRSKERKEKAPDQETLRAYAQAVLASAKYEDLLSTYSPHHWPHLKTAYAGKELLGIRPGITFEGPPKNTVVFTSDMYNEQEDAVTTLRSKWKLRSTGANGGYKVHASEIAPVI